MNTIGTVEEPSTMNGAAGLGSDSSIDLGALGWLDVLAILDGLQLLALEQHRQAVLSNDEDDKRAALAAERHADQLRNRLEGVAAAAARAACDSTDRKSAARFGS